MGPFFIISPLLLVKHFFNILYYSFFFLFSSPDTNCFLIPFLFIWIGPSLHEHILQSNINDITSYNSTTFINNNNSTIQPFFVKSLFFYSVFSFYYFGFYLWRYFPIEEMLSFFSVCALSPLLFFFLPFHPFVCIIFFLRFIFLFSIWIVHIF